MIITFSSGIITLFIYTASLVNNEVNKTNKKKTIIAIRTLRIMMPHTQEKKTQRTIKFFSKYPIIMMIAAILIVTMTALVSHGHRPHQTLNSSF